MTNDLISRAEVLKLIYDYKENHSENRKEYPINYGTLIDMIRWVRNLPSVTPIRPKGHWIDKQCLFESCSAECSSCHKRSNGYVYDNGFSLECKYYDFCPKCGSDNREVEE